MFNTSDAKKFLKEVESRIKSRDEQWLRDNLWKLKSAAISSCLFGLPHISIWCTNYVFGYGTLLFENKLFHLWPLIQSAMPTNYYISTHFNTTNAYKTEGVYSGLRRRGI